MALLFCAITAIIIICMCQKCSAEGTEQTVLMIDPGHGGLDGGAVAADGTPESGINLAISQRLHELCRLFGVGAVMTRTEETLEYPDALTTIHEKKVWDQKQRVELINRTPGAVLISIHQNKYPDPRPSGTQVFYGNSPESAALGTLTHELLISSLCPENRRVAAPISDKIYLFKNVSCPAVLVECGFLSNSQELSRLKTSEYQCALALVIFCAYMQYRH